MTGQTVAILGLGLIGGSLGLALKRSASPPVVVGWDRDAATLALAHRSGAVDYAAGDLTEAVANAELVVAAVPVLAVREIFAAIAAALPRHAVVTDVASTKVAACGWAAELLPAAFVGGHPMAGSERSGIANARADLFAGATYCLTPEATTPPSAVTRVTTLVEAVAARPHLLSPAAHDRAVAAVSHLPFLLSTALVDVTARSPEWELFRSVAATGFRDVSRLASGDPRMHRDICLTNAAEIRPWLIETARELEALAAELDDEAALQRRFEIAKAIRDALIERDGEPPI
ncbi:MAG: prephenate dehydrogenase/arogenate dehydrogenase family protein [Chloroflexota bacterium]|nr:prephenate dehydrogenase/arogenate dehydrogenase family protein [Chloroflexota bacterium]